MAVKRFTVDHKADAIEFKPPFGEVLEPGMQKRIPIKVGTKREFKFLSGNQVTATVKRVGNPNRTIIWVDVELEGASVNEVKTATSVSYA